MIIGYWLMYGIIGSMIGFSYFSKREEILPSEKDKLFILNAVLGPLTLIMILLIMIIDYLTEDESGK